MKMADIVTAYYSEPGDTTMRSMPYSQFIDSSAQNTITHFYSQQQINATIYMLLNSESAFSPLFSIQIAAFLMTLVRKNIIYPNTWHIIYALSLIFNVVVLITLRISDIIYIFIVSEIYSWLRFSIGLNKYISWVLCFSTYMVDVSCLNYSDHKEKIIHFVILQFILRKLYDTRQLYIRILPILDQIR
jgi:hypothetical protein